MKLIIFNCIKCECRKTEFIISCWSFIDWSCHENWFGITKNRIKTFIITKNWNSCSFGFIIRCFGFTIWNKILKCSWQVSWINETIDRWSKWDWFIRSNFSCELIVEIYIEAKCIWPDIIFWSFNWTRCSKVSSNINIKRTICKSYFNLIGIWANNLEWFSSSCMNCDIANLNSWILNRYFNFEIDWVGFVCDC